MLCPKTKKPAPTAGFSLRGFVIVLLASAKPIAVVTVPHTDEL
jgi:hypothetical protein